MLSLINSNKMLKLLTQIISILILSFIFTIIAKFLFTFGEYFGTFIRALYNIIVC